MIEPTIICKKCGNEFYKKKFNCPHCKNPGVTSLYKYVPFNKNALSILINKEVWFGKANSLNDPFEFQFSLKSDTVEGFPIDLDSLSEAMKESKELGVLCLSEVPDNILMWSHYSDQHKGFCIEFTRAAENRLGGDECVPVIYDEKTPEYDAPRIVRPESFARIATTKSTLWCYEREWRMISKEFGDQTFPLPAPIISIIFGVNMPRKNKETIANILGSEVEYKQAEITNGHYSLNIK